MSLAIAVGATMWTLLTVTKGADVHQDSTFPNEHACREGESVLLYGKTLEEKATADAKSKAEREARDKEWRDAHPPYEAKTKEELELIKDKDHWLRGHHIAGHDGMYTTVGKDGLLYDWPELVTGTSGVMWVTSGSDGNEVKYTKCFPTQ